VVVFKDAVGEHGLIAGLGGASGDYDLGFTDLMITIT
jgi:hypothetical protein